MLYLVATPIGNLQDITLRAIAILKSCDYILCEDTRHTKILLNHYQISKSLVSFHKFSEASKEERVISDLQQGLTVALVTDAGTPGIADPGNRLVQKCCELQIPVSSIPGPCAALVALTCSGLETDRFQFWGFLPRKQGEIRQALGDILSYPGTTICYESPKRLTKTLAAIRELAPDRKLVVARELTKKFEEIRQGTAEELIAIWTPVAPKGEIVLLFSGQCNSVPDWAEWSLEEHVAILKKSLSLNTQEAIKEVAALRGIPERIVYNKIHR